MASRVDVPGTSMSQAAPVQIKALAQHRGKLLLLLMIRLMRRFGSACMRRPGAGSAARHGACGAALGLLRGVGCARRVVHFEMHNLATRGMT